MSNTWDGRKVYDTDHHFVIDAFSREIKSKNPQKDVLIQNDHNSERFTFEVPRFIEGRDLALCNVVRVYYENGRSTGLYTVTDMDIYPFVNDMLTCSWLISQNATKNTGKLSFMLRFMQMNDDGTVEYAWGTKMYDKVMVVDDIDSAEMFEIEYVDIIQQWKNGVREELRDYVEETVETQVDVAQIGINKKNISELETDAATLKSRMDVFESLPEGSTTGDAELADVRVGFNGVTYNNAGSAVREQAATLSDQIDDITIPSINLFDKRRATLGKFLSYGNTGDTIDNMNGFFVSDYIEVKPDTLYNINVGNSEKMISEYDETLTHIISTSAWTITTQSNTKYIRFSLSTNLIDTTMVVEGTLPVTYKPYTKRINYDVFPTNELDGGVVKNGSVPVSKLAEYRATSDNLFDDSAITEGIYLYGAAGEVKEFDGYFTSDYISVKPNTVYSASYLEQVVFYNEYMVFIEKRTAVNEFTTPENAAFMRFSNNMSRFESTQFNEGDILLPYDKYSYTLDGFKESGVKPERIYTLGYAWNRWAVGEKFPIGILGDSTTDGASTTGWRTETGHEYLDNQAGGFGSIDYINENAYPYKLEALIRKELSNDVMRVYNIGYSGFSFYSIMQHYDAIFSGVYSDVKMIGINMGINDRIPSGKENVYYDDFRAHLIQTIEYLYEKKIQPFLITSQATVEPYPDSSLDYYPLRTSEYINSIANRVKHEVAQEYGLEIIDMTMYDEFMMTYSNHKITDIISDDLHYRDLGHTIEAEFLFSEMAPRTVEVTNHTRLGFASQRVKSECPSNMVIYRSEPIEKMKLSVDYTKADSTDIVLQDFIINITEKEPLTLKSYCTEVSDQYVVVDDVVTKITATQQEIGELDVGVHHIKAMSGTSSKANWVGFYFVS